MDTSLLDRCPPSFVDRVTVTDDCWTWTGVIDPSGYGRYSVPGLRSSASRTQGAHRFGYTQMVGPVPEGMELDHLCRTKSCVRPDHMEPVSPAENLRRQGLAVTHCIHGHEYTPENTGMRPAGRYCKTCHRDRERARYQRSRREAMRVGA